MTGKQNTLTKNSKNSLRRHGLILVALGLAMLGLAYAFVPLYETFCKFVGIPVPKVGTSMKPTKTRDTSSESNGREVTVRFIANTAVGVPIEFAPRTRAIKTRIGEPVLTAYDAKNLSKKSIPGTAVHTIVSQGGFERDVADNVSLMQCFCFEEQTYPAQKDITLPLSFTVDPSLPDNVHTVTFGYTLYNMDDY